jgi:hypothetical protein
MLTKYSLAALIVVVLMNKIRFQSYFPLLPFFPLRIQNKTFSHQQFAINLKGAVVIFYCCYLVCHVNFKVGLWFFYTYAKEKNKTLYRLPSVRSKFWTFISQKQWELAKLCNLKLNPFIQTENYRFVRFCKSELIKLLDYFCKNTFFLFISQK